MCAGFGMYCFGKMHSCQDHQSISLWLGHDRFRVYHRLNPYVCVDSSKCRLSGACFIYAMNIGPPHDGRHVAS